MPMGILFWVLMVLWLLFGLTIVFAPNYIGPGLTGGGNLLLFTLLFLLGWKTFGPPLQ